MLLTFKKFIKDKKGYYIKKKSLFLKTRYGDIKIAKSYIEIANISFKKAYSNGILLQIDFNYCNSLNGDIESNTLFIKLSLTGKIISFDCGKVENDNFIEIIKSTYKQEYKTTILNLYKEYFQKFFQKYTEKYPTILKKCGWYQTKYEKNFLSITCGKDYYPDFVKDLLDGNLKNHKKLTDFFSDLCKKSNSAGNLFEFIVSDPCILTVFAYSIHAISWNYVYGYLPVTSQEEIRNIFSLCIYGNEISTSKKLANLLSNFFTVKPNRWTIISRKYHISDTSSEERKFSYASIPIIITSKNNHFTRTSSIIKKIYQDRAKNKLYIYPVYINNSSIVGDEILNCCSDSLFLLFQKVNIEELREQFIGLIYNYISYLSNISSYFLKMNEYKYNFFIKEYYEKETIEKILFNYLDMPLLKNELNTIFLKQSLTYTLVKEWLDNYSLDKDYNLNLKRNLLGKWLDQYFLKNSFAQQDTLREILLEKIIEKWYFVEYAHKFDIPEEILQDPDLREQYSSILEKWQSEQTGFNKLRKEILVRWLHMHFPEFRLYQSINAFCNYLEDVSLTDVAINLKNYAEQCFLPQIQNNSSESLQPKLNYLNLLYLFVQESLKDTKNNIWLWEGQEPRGEKEFCYYLSCQQGLDEFNRFISRSSCPTIQKRKFDQLLKENKILKLPKGNSNTWERKKTSVYIFIKKELDKFSLNN